MKQKELVDTSASAGFIGNADLDQMVATLEAKAKLKEEQEKIVKLQAFDSSFFCGKSYFEDGDTQNYLVFQSMCRYL